MEKFIVTAAVAIIAVLFYIRKRRQIYSQPQADTDTSRPSADTLPAQQKANDKLILIKNVMASDLKDVLTGFCNSYNKEKYQVLLRLTELSGREFAITFPYDIDFEIYCYLINYLQYPMEIKWTADIAGWTTTKIGDEWIPKEAIDKKVMLFIPADDTEYDNVYMTTADNTGYKIGFSIGSKKRVIEPPKRLFASPNINISEFSGHGFEDFR